MGAGGIIQTISTDHGVCMVELLAPRSTQQEFNLSELSIVEA